MTRNPRRRNNPLRPRTRLTRRVSRIIHLLKDGKEFTIQAIMAGLGLPVGPRHRGTYLAVHRTLAALCRSGIIVKNPAQTHFEATYSLTEMGRVLVPRALAKAKISRATMGERNEHEKKVTPGSD